MNLVIDIGNTCCKVALYKKDEQVSKEVFNIEDYSVIIDYIRNNCKDIKFSILCSVSNHPSSLVELLKSISNLIIFNSETKTIINNKYQTPKTLGLDRLAAIIGAKKHYPNENILVIDIGTAITYDFVNKKNEYLGGGISPGLRLRFNSLNNFTSDLPLLKLNDVKNPDDVFDNIIGDSTKNSILSGVVNGTLLELKGVIEIYKTKYKNIRIVGTGGDFIFFENRLKNTIFANDDLVLEGLSKILEDNVK